MSTAGSPIKPHKHFTDPKDVRAILKDPGVAPMSLSTVVDFVREQTDLDLECLSVYARYILFFMHGEEHLLIRRRTAPFQRPVVYEGFRSQIAETVETHIAALPTDCDLANDFVWPLVFDVSRSVIGIPEADRETQLSWMHAIEPLILNQLKISVLKSAEPALKDFDARLVNQPPNPGSLNAFVTTECADLPEAAMRTVVASNFGGMLLVGHGLVNILSTLLAPADGEVELPGPDWLETHFEDLLQRHLPLERTSRVVTEPGSVCPYETGTLLVLDLQGVEERPSNRDSDGELGQHRRHLRFGSGPHMCPGGHLVRIILWEALLALSRRPLRGVLRPSDPNLRTIHGMALKTLPFEIKEQSNDAAR